MPETSSKQTTSYWHTKPRCPVALFTNILATVALPGKILIGGALAAALGGFWYQSSQVASVRQELAQSQQKIDQFHGDMQTSVAVAKTEVNETLAKINERVEQARREALAGSHRVQIAAKRQAGEVL